MWAKFLKIFFLMAPLTPGNFLTLIIFYAAHSHNLGISFQRASVDLQQIKTTKNLN